jgi:PIN domain nuclease of toxin-antitoxin system
MKYVVDTHALIWFLEGNARLGEQARAILSDPKSQLVLPAIALAEAMWIVEKGKTSIPFVAALLTAVRADPRLEIVALSVAIVVKTSELTAINEMHDRQIVATALHVRETAGATTVVSWDQDITASILVDVVW